MEWWERPSDWRWQKFRKEAAWRLKQVHMALEQRCAPEENFTLRSGGRAWFTFKAIVCVLFGLTDLTWRDDTISVAQWDYRSYPAREGTAWDWRALMVSVDRWAARVEVHGAP